MRATVVSDGSFANEDICAAGWAAWVILDGKEIKGYGSLKPSAVSVQLAELYAAMNGIWYAVRAGATAIELHTDSTTVVQLFTGVEKNQKLRNAFSVATSQPWFRLAKPTVAAMHIKGHQPVTDMLTKCHRWCDLQARRSMRATREGTRIYNAKG